MNNTFAHFLENKPILYEGIQVYKLWNSDAISGSDFNMETVWEKSMTEGIQLNAIEKVIEPHI